MATVKADLDPDAVLDELAEARACMRAGADCREQAEELIRQAKAAGVCSVPELAEAFGVSEGRVYQIVAPNYRK